MINAGHIQRMYLWKQKTERGQTFAPQLGRIVVQESYICLKILFMIREIIIEALKKRGIKQIELARHLDINRSSLNAFLKGNGKISLANVEKSFLFLGIEMVLKDRQLQNVFAKRYFQEFSQSGNRLAFSLYLPMNVLTL